MWILIKLIVTFIAFVIRFYGKHFQRQSEFTRESDGIKYFVRQRKHKSSVIGTDIKIPFSCGSVFKITQEGALDRFFKGLGLAEEFQTGDDVFDRSFYLASDCSEFRFEVKQDHLTRKHISELFQQKCKSIFCDGHTLTVRFNGDISSREATAVHTTIGLFKQISNLGQHRPRFISDPFQLKVLVIEAMIWALAAYAFTGFFEYIWVQEDIYFFPAQVTQKGLICGAILAAAILFLIFLFIRGSSRGHRILIESFFVLCISLPLGGINLVSDINIEMDKSTPVFVPIKITNLYFKVSRSRKGGSKTNYYLDMVAKQKVPFATLPMTLKINSDQYSQLTGATDAEIEMGNGYLKMPWIKNITRADF